MNMRINLSGLLRVSADYIRELADQVRSLNDWHEPIDVSEPTEDDPAGDVGGWEYSLRVAGDHCKHVHDGLTTLDEFAEFYCLKPEAKPVKHDRVLFLDIDGVLNCHEELHPDVLCGQFHRDKVERLNRILYHTGAKIVLSSAWRYLLYRGDMNLSGLDWLLRNNGVFAGRIIGVTRKDTMRESDQFDGKNWPVCNERGQQITDWLKENPGTVKYAVIDDLDLGISEAGHPFVHTDGSVGITDDEANQIIALLS
jgi:hypothetical protein